MAVIGTSMRRDVPALVTKRRIAALPITSPSSCLEEVMADGLTAREGIHPEIT
eukprot:UN3113